MHSLQRRLVCLDGRRLKRHAWLPKAGWGAHARCSCPPFRRVLRTREMRGQVDTQVELHECEPTRTGGNQVGTQEESSEKKCLEMSLVPQRKKKHISRHTILLSKMSQKEKEVTAHGKSSTYDSRVFAKHLQPVRKALGNKNARRFRWEYIRLVF